MHAIRKPPRDGGETPWHQDEAYWDPAMHHEAISVWMPLQPATIDNGCMQFVPGSHLDGVHEHRLINPESHGLVLDDLGAVVDPVPCPLPPGGATVHSSRTCTTRPEHDRRAPASADHGVRAGATAARGASGLLWQRPEWSE